MCESCACKPLARSEVYQFLSLGFAYPDSSHLRLMQRQLPSVETSLSLLEDQESLEVFQALAPPLAVLTTPEWGRLYVHCFGHEWVRAFRM